MTSSPPGDEFRRVRIGGRFELIERIPAGRPGVERFRARDVDGAACVVTILAGASPKALDDLVKALARVDHPSIVAPIASGTDEVKSSPKSRQLPLEALLIEAVRAAVLLPGCLRALRFRCGDDCRLSAEHALELVCQSSQCGLRESFRQ